MIQSKLSGVFIIFLFHAITMFVLCPSKYSRIKTVAVWGTVTVICALGSFLLIRTFPVFNGAILTFSIAVVLFSVTVFFLSRNVTYHTLFLLLTYMEAFMVSVFLSGFTSQWFFQGDMYVAIIIRSGLQLVITLACILLRKKFETLSQGITKGWWSLNLLSLLLLAYVTGLTLHSYSSHFSNPMECASVFLLIVILVAVYAVFFHTIHLMYTAAEKQRAELQSQFLLRQIETMQESVQEARRIRHDARHHSMQILEYLQNNEYEALRRYLGDYEQNAEKNATVSLCENLAANSILCAYIRKAEQNGITVHADVTLERDMGISDIDMVAILANLMENAIYGCLRSGESHPIIDVYIGPKAKKLVIYVRNTSCENIAFENGLPKSHTGGGVGITSILHSASHYGGEYDFRNENGLFSCQILLRLPTCSLVNS